jgi:hypothetical protein
MPACTSFDFIRVAFTGNSLRGWYYPYPNLLVNDYSTFAYYNTTAGYPKLEVYNLSGSDFAWGLFTTESQKTNKAPSYRSRQIAGPGQNPNTPLPDCPVVTWVYGRNVTTSGSVPATTGKILSDVHRALADLIG